MSELSQVAILRISDEDTLRLISEYEREPALWHTRHRHYRVRKHRLAAAERIARKLNIENFQGKHVITKFKNLRNSYCQELKKIALSLAEGVQDSEIYRPRVFWFSKMDAFIRPHLLPPRSKLYQYPFVLDGQNKDMEKLEDQQNYIGQDTFESQFVGVDNDARGEEWNPMAAVRPEEVLRPPLELAPLPSPLHSVTESQAEPLAMQPEPQLQQADSNQRDSDDEEDDKPLAKRFKPKKYRPQTYFDQTLSAKLLKRITKVLDRMSRSREDSFDSFGKYVASTMRGLPRERALAAQLRVVELLTGLIGEEQGRADGVDTQPDM